MEVLKSQRRRFVVINPTNPFTPQHTRSSRFPFTSISVLPPHSLLRPQRSASGPARLPVPLRLRSAQPSGMSQFEGSSSGKRKRPEMSLVSGSLTDAARRLYNLIRSREGMGIWIADMKRETNLPDSTVKKSLKSLVGSGMIKEVVNVQSKGRKHYMSTEFEPSKELTGGDWYEGGKLDTVFIKMVKDVCVKHINRLKVATRDGIFDFIKNGNFFTTEVTKQQVDEILGALVLDNEIVEMKSNGFGDFAAVPVGKVCYKCKSKGKGEQKSGNMVSCPCGVCPRIKYCTEDGIISPRTCVYYDKWLELDF